MTNKLRINVFPSTLSHNSEKITSPIIEMAVTPVQHRTVTLLCINQLKSKLPQPVSSCSDKRANDKSSWKGV